MIDRQTIDRLVIEQLPSALRFAQRLTGSADLAEDLVQETLTRVLKRWKTLNDEGAFRAWMMQILVNADRDRRRMKQSQQSQQSRLEDSELEQIAAATPEPHENVSAVELKERIRATINGLPERQRQVAWLRFGENFNAKEIAETLGITVANVNACLNLARKRIALTVGVEVRGRNGR